RAHRFRRAPGRPPGQAFRRRGSRPDHGQRRARAMDGGYLPDDQPRAPGHSPDWRPRDPVRGPAPVPAGPPPDAERGRGDRREMATEPQPGEPLLVGIDPANAKARGAGESGEDPADQANRLASGRRLAVADLFFRLLV